MKKTYDPALRKTATGKRLYYYWKQVRKKPHTPDWDHFPAFHAWATRNGFTLDARLFQIDATLPYRPDNCMWKVKVDEDAITLERAAEWDAAINRIRKNFGMEPLQSVHGGE